MSHDKIYLISPPPPNKALWYSFDRWRSLSIVRPAYPWGGMIPHRSPRKPRDPPNIFHLFPPRWWIRNSPEDISKFKIDPKHSLETRKPHDPISFPRWWNFFPVKVIVAALWEFSSALRKVFKNFLQSTLRRPSLEARTAHNFGQRQFCKFIW